MATTLKAFRIDNDLVEALKAAAIKPTTQTEIVHRALRRELGLNKRVLPVTPETTDTAGPNGPDVGGGVSSTPESRGGSGANPDTAADFSTDEAEVQRVLAQNPDKSRAYAEALVRQQRKKR